MIRRLLPVALLALPMLLAPAQAQDEAARVVELRIVALSRGYMRPMKNTADRIRQAEGIESCEALGYGGDAARYKVTTRLDDDGLARVLQLNILGRGKDFLTLSNSENQRARRAEARGVITQIALAITRQPKPSWDSDSEPMFNSGDNVNERMRRLELDPELLKGTFYKPADYHIEEEWDGSGGTYKIWAGDRWEGVYVPSDDWWREGEMEEPDSQPQGDSRFVGIRIYRSPWSNSMSWVDTEGLLLDSTAGERSETDGDGVLLVQHGADWLRDIMCAAVAFLVRDPKLSIDRLPGGRGWNIFNLFDEENPKIDRWDLQHYDRNALTLKWREEEGRKIANLRAHHPAHAFYLELEVDATAVLEDYKQRAQDENLDLKTVTEVEPGDALTWICGAEESVEVFRARELEAEASFKLIRDALQTASKTHPLADLCGRLDDEDLRARLGIELKFDSYASSDYEIAAQMLGDVEVTVGSVRTGGRSWMLLNASSGIVIRSNR